MTDLLKHFQARLDAMLEQVRGLVEQESPTQDAAATTKLTTQLADRFKALGFNAELQPTAAGSHLIAKGTLGASPEARPVMLLGHVDTVWPQGTLAKMPFRIEDGRAYGPGIVDMKSGIIVMLEALTALQELNLKPNRPITVFLSCDEESGSQSSQRLIENEAKQCAAVLVFEPPLPGGIAKTQRKGIVTYKLIARGVSAHSGVDPDKGASAITEMAHQILALQQLNNLPEGISVNTGVVRGGTFVNVVAAEAHAEIDVRFQTQAQGEIVMRQVESLRPMSEKTQVEIIRGPYRPPFERTAQVVGLFEKARSIAAELDFQLREGSTGGGSDGNFTAALGIPTLDGLGVDGAGPHAIHEHIIIEDLPRRAAFLTKLLLSL